MSKSSNKVVKEKSESMMTKFPLHLKETLFMTVNIPIIKAMLCCGDTVLSVYIPDNDLSSAQHSLKQKTQQTSPKDAKILLDFFSGVPFYGGLAANWDVSILIYTEDQTPSLTYCPCDTNLTWNEVKEDIYCVDVKVWNDTGCTEKEMVYLRSRGGFRAIKK